MGDFVALLGEERRGMWKEYVDIKDYAEPALWKEGIASNGESFWYKPTEVDVIPCEDILSSPDLTSHSSGEKTESWKRATAKDGKPFYYNAKDEGELALGLSDPSKRCRLHVAPIINTSPSDALHNEMKKVAKKLKAAGITSPWVFHKLFQNCGGGGSMTEIVDERFSTDGRLKIWNNPKRRLMSTPFSWTTFQ